jgi:hypothetical protein
MGTRHAAKIFLQIQKNQKSKIKSLQNNSFSSKIARFRFLKAVFFPLYLVYSQIWLNYLMDDCHFNCIKKRKGKKKNTGTYFAFFSFLFFSPHSTPMGRQHAPKIF